MDIELGIRNVARPVNFSTDDSADKVSQVIADAVANGTMIDLTDSKGRRILVPGTALGLRDHRFRDTARRGLRRPVI